ncbi:MAG: HD domain-containing protein [Maribacter sp.]|nr:HD domain-containing protein [Maribacter sp.]
MTHSEIVEKAVIFVKATLKNAEGGHDWFHIKRVFVNAIQIAKEEKVNVLVVSLAALLHDIADSKFHNGDENLGPQLAGEFLASLNMAPDLTRHVLKIIENISFKNSFSSSKGAPFTSLELQVVQDADRLDAMGAIGIARAFNYGGFMNRAIYDPEIMPKLNMTKEEYKRSNAPTINHFYEKLLLLKDRMNTVTGKKLAKERHQFMLDFLEQFYKECGNS